MNIDLSKSFTAIGEFSVPGSEKNWNGTLYYDPNNGTTLHLRNLPLSFEPGLEIPIITGLLYDEPHSCTLNGAILQKSQFSGNPDGMMGVFLFSVKYVYLGKCYSTINELRFTQIECEYSNFREWLNLPTIHTSREDHNSDIKITISKQTQIKGSLDELFDYQIHIFNMGSYTEKSFASNFEQNVVFTIASKKNQLLPLSQYLEMNKIVKYFLMFLQGRYVVERSIVCNKPDQMIGATLLQFYNPYKPALNLQNAERFTRSYNKSTFDDALQKWVKKYKIMSGFFDRYFENVIKEELSPIDKFENLIQSLLFYHQYKFPTEVTSEEEYKEFFDKLISKLSDKEAEFVNRFRSLGNKLSLKKQLEAIFKLAVNMSDRNSKKHIERIVSLRNQIEHSSGNSPSDILQPASNFVYDLTALIRILLCNEIDYEQTQ